ncbi:UDP-glycosyltransferase UGT5 [Musca vetustissima]|uniref:UDP-glycosyltransferase UGT5 n=1 Tax=Musca vetustissima TaxID=27455 RepID=UPI002AB6BBF6|nr:UDP-glycosyltransferase UGT5 [Musca vetustissima]
MLRPQFASLVLSVVVITSWAFQLTDASNIVALFINGHRSHLLFYISIVNLLLERGHHVTVVTTLDIREFDAAPDNLRWIKLSSNYTISRRLSNSNTFDQLTSMTERIDDTAEFMNDPTWQKFMQDSTQHFDLMLLGYLFNDYQLGVAAHFNCPSVVVWTGQPIGFIHRLIGNPQNRWYVPQPYDRHQYKGWRGVAIGWFETFVETVALHKMKEIYDQHFSQPDYPTFWEIRKNVSLAIVNHHSLSEGPIAPQIPGLIEVGGLEYRRRKEHSNFNEQYDTDLNNILNNGKGIIYISFGSRVKWSMLDGKLENIFIEAFKLFTNYTIIWTYDNDCRTLERQSPNIKCRAWWPQTAILACNNTKLFITHGGKGSISEVYSHAKPILGFAFFGDQRANVARVQTKQLGKALDIYNLELAELVDALNELLNTERYHRNARTFSQLYRDRPLSSEENLVYWLEYVIRHRGAKHLHSPLLDLNLFEYYLIDIYLIFIVLLLTCIHLLNWLERQLGLKS